MIRLAKVEDAEQIQKINQEELGYNYPVKQTKENLTRLLADSKHHLLLVFENDGKVIGYVHTELFEETYFPPMYNVLALAVAKSAQQKGIGTQLMNAVEQFAEKAGINEIRLNSGEERYGAHQFYERLGYHCSKKQKRFGKLLD
jgi:predicted N-acetyltransferase YhbS